MHPAHWRPSFIARGYRLLVFLLISVMLSEMAIVPMRSVAAPNENVSRESALQAQDHTGRAVLSTIPPQWDPSAIDAYHTAPDRGYRISGTDQTQRSPASPSRLPLDSIPLLFVPNLGQEDATVDFRVEAGQGSISFMSTGASFAAPPQSIDDTHGLPIPPQSATSTRTTAPVPVSDTELAMSFVGANPKPTIQGVDLLAGTYSEYGPTNSVANVPTYAGIRYQSLYPGIDLEYRGDQGQLKGTYYVAPGANPSHIRWHYPNSTIIQPQVDGSLVISDTTTHDIGSIPVSIMEHAPLAWQETDQGRIIIAVHYTVNAQGIVGFEVGSYDVNQPLIIDPTITFRFMSTSYRAGQAIEVDATGRMYILAACNDLGGYFTLLYIFTPPSASSSWSIDVIRYNDMLLYGIDIDAQHHIVMAGAAKPYLLVRNPFNNAQTYTQYNYRNSTDTVGESEQDAIILELDAANMIIDGHIALFGGRYNDILEEVVFAGTSIIATGSSRSTNFYTTPNQLQPLTIGNGNATICDPVSYPVPQPDQNANNCSDAIVIALPKNNFSALIMSSTLGGSAQDFGKSLDVTPDGRIILSGTTVSPSILGHTGFQGGFSDGFVAALAPITNIGSGLIDLRYIGGTQREEVTDSAVIMDSSGNASVAVIGYTSNHTADADLTFPTTSGAVQTSPAPRNARLAEGGFVTKYTLINGAFTQLYSTLLDGSDSDD